MRRTRRGLWTRHEFRIERFDSAWGGWRYVPKSDTSDEPATFSTIEAADDACQNLRRRSNYAYRVVEVHL